jgi:hypothetical protein
MKSNCCNANIIENTDLCSQCKEHCLILLKPNNTNLAKFYGLTRQTIGTYKKDKPLIYRALKEDFIKYNKT